MLRVAVALGLFTAAAAESSGHGFIHWLEEHGVEALETAEECVAAGSVIAKLQESGCSATAEQQTESLVGLALWGLVEGLEASGSTLAKTNISQFTKEFGIAAVKRSTHEQMETFCGKPACMDLFYEFISAYAQCYGRTTCALATQADMPLAYDDCRPIITGYVAEHTAQQMHSLCSTEGSQPFYCVEEQTGLLLKDPACYIQLYSAGIEGDCEQHPDCVSMWNGAKKEHPHCSTMLQAQAHASVTSSLHMMKKLLSKFTDPDIREQAKNIPDAAPLFMEVCGGEITINV